MAYRVFVWEPDGTRPQSEGDDAMNIFERDHLKKGGQDYHCRRYAYCNSEKR